MPLPLLQAVWEGELDAHLRELMRLEFLHAKSGGGEPLCAFTHSLTRDVAYESLPPARRRVLHGAIARALEAVYADRLAEVYDRLAYHYGRTDEATKAVLYLDAPRRQGRRRPTPTRRPSGSWRRRAPTSTGCPPPSRIGAASSSRSARPTR